MQFSKWKFCVRIQPKVVKLSMLTSNTDPISLVQLQNKTFHFFLIFRNSKLFGNWLVISIYEYFLELIFLFFLICVVNINCIRRKNLLHNMWTAIAKWQIENYDCDDEVLTTWLEVGWCGNKLMLRLSLGNKLMPPIRRWGVGWDTGWDNDIIIGAIPVHKKAGICRNGAG